MVSLLEALPLLDGWEYHVRSFVAEDLSATPPVIQPGTIQLVSKGGGAGWVIGALATFGSVYGRLVIEGQQVKVGEQNRLDASPFVLISGGVTKPMNQGIYVARYGKTLYTAQKTVAVPATPELLAAAAIGVPLPDDIEAVIQALKSNLGNVYISSTQAGALANATRYPMAPGDAARIKLQNINRVWLGVDNASEGVAILSEYPDTVNADAQYTLAFTPAYPLPYHQGFQVYLLNPRDLPASAGGGTNRTAMTINSFYAAHIDIGSVDVFVDSLRKLLGSLSSGQVDGLQTIMRQAKAFAR